MNNHEEEEILCLNRVQSLFDQIRPRWGGNKLCHKKKDWEGANVLSRVVACRTSFRMINPFVGSLRGEMTLLVGGGVFLRVIGYLWFLFHGGGPAR